jgi:hypothetical protein
MEISEEISTILGDTVKIKRQKKNKNPSDTFLSCVKMVVDRIAQRQKYMDDSCK